MIYGKKGLEIKPFASDDPAALSSRMVSSAITLIRSSMCSASASFFRFFRFLASTYLGSSSRHRSVWSEAGVCLFGDPRRREAALRHSRYNEHRAVGHTAGAATGPSLNLRSSPRGKHQVPVVVAFMCAFQQPDPRGPNVLGRRLPRATPPSRRGKYPLS